MKKFLLLTFIIAIVNSICFSQDIIKTCPVRKHAKFQFTPEYNSKTIKLKKGTNVDVIGIEGEYYKVNYKGQIGYIDNIYIYDPELLKIRDNIKKKKARTS
ncbi:MAG TPA: hypothetical protein VKA27_04905 [Sunxiuqinia sp.]|nr:hypothetical protein [Sunxiuqinia sp.]